MRSRGRQDSLLKVEERETDAVLDENGEILSFHHDRPVGENEALVLGMKRERQENFFPGPLSWWTTLTKSPLETGGGKSLSWYDGWREKRSRGDDTLIPLPHPRKGHYLGRHKILYKVRDTDLWTLAKGRVGSSLLPSGLGPYISTVSTSVGHQPWISQVRSTEL